MDAGVTRLGAADYDRIVALWRAAGLTTKPTGRDRREAFEAQMQFGRQTVLGVETAEGALVGVIIATHDGRKGWLNRIAVHPEHRRAGIATRLIRAAEAALRREGIEIFAALIEPDNEESLALLLAAGYEDWPGIHYLSRRDRPDA